MKIRLLFTFIALGSLTACHSGPRHGIHVYDATTRQPIENASVVILYPSGASTEWRTDKYGMAYAKNGFGPPECGVHFEVLTASQLTSVNLASAHDPEDVAIREFTRP